MMLSNAYVSQARQNTLRIALASTSTSLPSCVSILTSAFPPACAIAAQRFDTVVEQTRKIVYTHQFNDEPIRLLLTSLASGLRPAADDHGGNRAGPEMMVRQASESLPLARAVGRK